jgi:hypothetical protein
MKPELTQEMLRKEAEFWRRVREAAREKRHATCRK